MDTQPSTKLSFAQILGIVGALAAIVSFFAFPWYAKAAHRVSMPSPFGGSMGSFTEPGMNATAYEISQLHGILWLIPIGVAFVAVLVFAAPRLGIALSRIASLVSGIVPFIIYVSIAGEDMKHTGFGFIIAAIGTALAIYAVFTLKQQVTDVSKQ